MIKDYSILFNGMSDGNKIFYYSLNDNTPKSIIMKVYNQYLEYVEYESSLTLDPGINYWTSVNSNLTNIPLVLVNQNPLGILLPWNEVKLYVELVQ